MKTTPPSPYQLVVFSTSLGVCHFASSGSLLKIYHCCQFGQRTEKRSNKKELRNKLFNHNCKVCDFEVANFINRYLLLYYYLLITVDTERKNWSIAQNLAMQTRGVRIEKIRLVLNSLYGFITLRADINAGETAEHC